MQISARNQIKGTVKDIEKGAVNAIVHIEIAGGTVVTSSITMESVAKLGLEVGQEAYAVVKASDVMVAID